MDAKKKKWAAYIFAASITIGPIIEAFQGETTDVFSIITFSIGIISFMFFADVLRFKLVGWVMIVISSFLGLNLAWGALSKLVNGDASFFGILPFLLLILAILYGYAMHTFSLINRR